MQNHDIVFELGVIEILIGLVMILIIEPKVIQEIHQQLSKINLIPLLDKRQQHNNKRIGLQPPNLRLAKFVIVRQILDHVKDRLEDGVSPLLLVDKTCCSSAYIAPVHAADVDEPVFLGALGLQLDF